MAIHFQEGIKMQCKQMWTKFYVFCMVTNLIFSKALQDKLCFTLPFITAYYECKR